MKKKMKNDPSLLGGFAPQTPHQGGCAPLDPPLATKPRWSPQQSLVGPRDKAEYEVGSLNVA